MTPEHGRLDEARKQGTPWRKWGPYLSERQWGTVREDYSDSGDAWNYFTHDQARSRAYRWGEDGLAGPYDDLVRTNRTRGRDELEYELLDTGIFDDDRYFDVFVEYAKASPEDILIQVTVHNRGPDPAGIHVLPTLWFRNEWS